MTDPAVFRVLLVDDNMDDISLLREAFSEWSSLAVDLAVFQDGASALEYLRSSPGSIPDLMVIDLKLPGLSGFQTLEGVKAIPRLSEMPVAVLTTSRSEDDERESLSWGADSFLSKPSGWAGYRDLVKTLETYKNDRQTDTREESYE